MKRGSVISKGLAEGARRLRPRRALFLSPSLLDNLQLLTARHLHIEEDIEDRRREGFVLGYRQGVAELARILLKAQQEAKELALEQDQTLANLACKMAAKVLNSAPELSSDTIRTIVSEVLEEFAYEPPSQVTIFAGPKAFQALDAERQSLAPNTPFELSESNAEDWFLDIQCDGFHFSAGLEQQLRHLLEELFAPPMG